MKIKTFFKMHKTGKNLMVAALAFGTVTMTLGVGSVANADVKSVTDNYTAVAPMNNYTNVDKTTQEVKDNHEPGVYVTANSDGFEYKNFDLTDNQKIAFHKGDIFRISDIVRVNGKVRLQLPDGNYISAYRADVNNEFTDMKALNKMVANVENVEIQATTTKKHVSKKHARKANAMKKRRVAKKYYVRTPKGKKHVVFIKRNILMHNNKHRMTAKRAKYSHISKGTKLIFKKIVRHGHAYRIMLSRHVYLTANKAFVRVFR